MSAPPLSKLIRFILIAAGLIIVFSVAWSFVDAEYSNFLAAIARGVVSSKVVVEQEQGTITFIHHEYQMGLTRQVKDWIDASAIQFGLLLAVALVAATPGLKTRQRFLFSALAVAITFVLQILSVLVMARTFNSLFFVVASDVFPPILWAVFSFKYWFARPVPSPTAQIEPPNADKKKGKKSR
jgi:hypothetical protein